MIEVKISGGLGNQMFQYAFIATANNGQVFFLEKTGDPIELYKYFKLKKNIFYFIDILFFNYTGFKLFFSHHLRKVFYSVIKKLFISKTIRVSNTDKPVLQSSNYSGVLFEGYFQSPLYFENHTDEVFKFFELKNSIKKVYRDQYDFLNQKGKKVVVHIRRTDYANLGHLNLGEADLCLPLTYYHKLIKNIHSPDNYYIFISDEPEFISQEFNYINDKHVSRGSAIVDFQHMLNADLCIISNSTFSWWAAYLNKNDHKIVYCPRYFLGFLINQEYPNGIYPSNWIQVEIDKQ